VRLASIYDLGVADPTENFSDDKVKNYIAKTANGYHLVVYKGAGPGEGAEEKDITEADYPGLPALIEALLAARKTAGEHLSDLIRDRGIISASAHRATIALGEGD
jgi:hypothetical protein